MVTAARQSRQGQDHLFEAAGPGDTTAADAELPTMDSARTAMNVLVKEMRDTVEKLKQKRLLFTANNEELRKLLKLRGPAGMEAPSPIANTRTSTLVQGATVMKRAFERLHQSIRSMNPMDSPFRIDLKLVANLERAMHSARAQFDYLQLRTKGDFFYLGLQICDREDGQAASDVFSETKINYDPNDEDPQPLADQDLKAVGLQRGKGWPDESNKGFKFEVWGDVVYEQPESLRDLHRLFRNRKQKWKAVETLASFMGSEGAPKHMQLWQRVELIKLAVYAQLCLTPGVRSACQPLTLSRFVYYIADDQADVPRWAAASPLMLKPYINIGFGRRNEGDGDQALHYIVELGIVLVQIAGCVALAVNTEADPKEGVDRAREQLERLGRQSLLPLAQIAKDCIDFVADGTKNEDEFLVNRLLRLEDLGLRK